MTLVDFFLAAIILGIVVYGLKRGFFKEVASFLGFFLGGFLAIFFSYDLARFIRGFVPLSEKVTIAVALLFIFFVVVMGFHFLGVFLHQASKLLMLSWLDHLAGAVFGLLKGGLLLLLLIMLGTLLALPAGIQKRLENSLLVSQTHQAVVRYVESCHLCPFPNRQELLRMLRPEGAKSKGR